MRCRDRARAWGEPAGRGGHGQECEAGAGGGHQRHLHAALPQAVPGAHGH